MDCPLSQFTMKTRFEHCSDDLTHPRWVSSSLVLAHGLSFALVTLAPTLPLLLEAM